MARKFLFSAVLLVSLFHAQSISANTCNGACGGPSADGSCYCDESCFEYGDCCGDVCNACPTLSGCGGNPVCGNGMCEAGETQQNCPADCSGGQPGDCGGISFEGCCDGQTVKYCEGGQLKTLDCSQNPSCGWQPSGPFYDCGTGGGADPSGMFPINCTGGSNPVCGNAICEAGETQQSCPADCSGGNPVCGNAICESGETQQSCPADCSGGSAVCGNGICEAGETQQSCPADCGSGDPCADWECGSPPGTGVDCGTCPAGEYCHFEGYCLAENCQPDCEGKECGSDGCEGSCGSCSFGEECQVGKCVGGTVVDTDIVEGDGNCFPDCTGRVCGFDGCGGLCPPGCQEGYGCTGQGLCEEGYVDPNADDKYDCAEGEILYHGICMVNPCLEGEILYQGVCIPDPSTVNTGGSGCAVSLSDGTGPASLPAAWPALLLFALVALGRRLVRRSLDSPSVSMALDDRNGPS